MVPIRLALKNFMCYHDNVPPLDFGGFHVACLCGDNGAGKSTILDAITWALWGQTRAKADDDLIHQGEAETQVEFDFAVGQNRYRVIRKRVRPGLKRAGQSLLEFQAAAAGAFLPITGNTLRDTQRKIIDTLRMDYQTFVNSALLLQGRSAEFSMKRPGERKEVLANILGLSQYDDLEKLAKDSCSQLRSQAAVASADIVRMDEQLKQKNAYQAQLQQNEAALSALASQREKKEVALVDLQKQKDALKFKGEQCQELDKSIAERNRQLKYFAEEVQKHRTRVEQYRKTLSSYQEEHDIVQKRLAQVLLLENSVAGKREIASRLVSRTDYLVSTNETLKKEGIELKNKIDILRGGSQCPLCGSDLGEEGVARIKASYETQRQEKASAWVLNDKELKLKDAELKAVKQDLARQEVAASQERSKIETRAQILERDRVDAEKLLPAEQDAMAKAEKAVEDLKQGMQADLQKSISLKTEIEGLPRLEDVLRQTDAACRLLREQERTCQDKVVESRARLSHLDQLEADRKEKATRLESFTKEAKIYEELAVAFGKKGVQALLIETALPEIEQEADGLLSRMTNNRMHLAIETQRDTRTAGTVETLDIKISDELGTRNYEMFSGGEAFRVDFALRIALSRLLARRAGAPMPTLIIDEGFGTQDSIGRERLVEAITSIQDDFEKILVITHIDELKDAFPVRIDVTKGDDGSTFAMG